MAAELPDELPDDITKINDSKKLVKLLAKVCDRGEKQFSIQDGHIYVKDCYEPYGPSELWFMSIFEINELYKLYKQFKDSRYHIRTRYNVRLINNTIICGVRYFMLNGSFELVYADMDGKFYETEDLIFCPPKPNTYIVETASGYYCVPNQLDVRRVTPYTPIKSVFKFTKFLKMDGETFYSLGYNEYYHVVDQYDKNKSFLCYDTYNIINAETGESIKSWPLSVVSDHGAWKKIAIEILKGQYIRPPKVHNEDFIKLLYDKHWQMYYVHYEGDFYELRSCNSGKATKAAAAADE
jgi:hypothetical protein